MSWYWIVLIIIGGYLFVGFIYSVGRVSKYHDVNMWTVFKLTPFWIFILISDRLDAKESKSIFKED